MFQSRFISQKQVLTDPNAKVLELLAAVHIKMGLCEIETVSKTLEKTQQHSEVDPGKSTN